jgi:hypothetical protein
MNIIRRIAQVDPTGGMGAAPPADPGLGTPPMDPMTGGMGAMPPMGGPPTMPMAAPGAPPAKREEIGSPLDSLGKILYDIDIVALLISKLGEDTDDTARYVWTLYGGNDTGGVVKGRFGKRVKQKDVDPEKEKEEQERTEDSRWERLPEGKYISDLTDLDEIVKEVKGIAASAVKNEIKAQGAAAGGGMPMASRNRELIRMAEKLDKIGFYKMSDTILLKIKPN